LLFVRALLFVLGAVTCVASAGFAANPAFPPAIRTLLSQAQAEGDTATVFGPSFDPQQAADLSKRMSAFYGVPITMTMTSGLHPVKLGEILQSSKLGVKSGIDVFWTGAALGSRLEENNLIDPTDLVKTLGLNAALRMGPHGVRVHDGTLGMVIYNTKQVSAAEAPRSFADLVNNPKWRGRIAAPRAPDVFIYIASALGDAPTRALIKGLMEKQQLSFLPSFPDVRTRVASGEFAIGIGVDATTLMRQGAPVANAPINPLVLTPWATWIMKDAAHPATAKLFTYWSTTLDGQHEIYDLIGQSLVTTPGTALAEQAKGKKVAAASYDYTVNEFPKLLPVYSELTGIR
jgi:ABC-type Fe3+ transport system substrate-binding protein